MTELYVDGIWTLDAKPQRAAFIARAAKGAYERLEELGELEPGSTDPELVMLQLLAATHRPKLVPVKLPVGRPKVEPKPNSVRAGGLDFEVRVMVPKAFEVPLEAPRWKQIALEVCHRHRLSFKDICGPGRFTHFARCRHEIYYRLVKELGLSLTLTGRLMGGKDHTTILHGVRMHTQRLIEAAAKAEGEAA